MLDKLITLIKQNNLDAIADLILNKHIDSSIINQLDKNGLYPLYYAIGYAGYNLIKLLINNGAKVNVESNNLRPILQIYVMLSNQDIRTLRLLISKGADINARDNIGFTALHTTCYGKTTIVKILIEAGANINDNYNIYKHSPLYIATHHGNNEIVQLLLINGANSDDINFRKV